MNPQGKPPLLPSAVLTSGTSKPHITVCICTFKRAVMLNRLLDALNNQTTGGLFCYSVVVADNDRARSAESVVTRFLLTSHVAVRYCVEPRQNIALVRNAALQCAESELIAFIDDDEFPDDNWLYALFQVIVNRAVDGVLGPVKPYFEAEPPQWVRKGGFFVRPSHPTGYLMTWPEARTGNVLFRRGILDANEIPFRPQFDTAGEDLDFFRRMMEKGCEFVWCEEATVYEVVPQSRCKRRYLLRRALLRGSNFTKHPAHRLKNITKSLLAVPCYTMILPVVLVFGEHLFLRYLIKLLDHTSRLFAFLGWRIIRERA